MQSYNQLISYPFFPDTLCIYPKAFGSSSEASEALTGWTKNKRCPYNVWGESVLKAVPDAPGNGCYHAETYESASDICKANNGRLCTKEELLGDCSRGTGCIHDNDLIWSSTPVPESPATCKAATQECNASSECCSGECFGDFTCA